jgi:hypothetical protein
VEIALPEETFDVAVYESLKADIPSLDDHRAARITLKFSGSAPLDRTSADDLELLKAMRLARRLRLIVVGDVAQKSYAVDPSGEEVSFTCSLRIVAIEGAESA